MALASVARQALEMIVKGECVEDAQASDTACEGLLSSTSPYGKNRGNSRAQFSEDPRAYGSDGK